MEIKTSKQIWKIVGDETGKWQDQKQTMKEYLEKVEKRWVSADSLLERINNAIDNGNIEGGKGFSAALFLSELIKELEAQESKKSKKAK